ncbi:ComEC/Rec2 family competence protein [Rhodonellum sp.]|uniref:ComEC/Rec2 family competence protein n=1 Tax=Rhodonellum sp. TaxID=2231180 RepID=UPI0027270BDF|nr:ComEC/Rec2 family competence protein [Rhodonellum sp.]MDO9551745.1 ComEC/Rec2 family competence protein [Rhodonellum sp.]
MENSLPMRFSEFPFLRYILFFVLGILLYPLLDSFSPQFYLGFLVSLFLAYVLLLVVQEKWNRFLVRPWLSVLAYAQLLFAGAFFSHLTDSQNHPQHILHREKPLTGYVAVVLGNDEQKPNSIANRLLLKSGFEGKDHFPLQGEILIYHRGDAGLQPGDLLWVKGMPQEISPPDNPKEFNYRKFLQRQQISHQHFIGNRFRKLGTVNEQPVEDLFLKIRSGILREMDLKIIDYQANQVAKALLLGQKKNMQKDLSEAYASTGAMHILAVSGLHVGIVYGFFFLFVKPFRLSLGKRILYLSFLILIIWGYALLTGMSPSVMRAATMFSLMALAQMKSRSPSIFNAIALSALILLAFDPFLIYAVGFQLSYMALLGILLFQPLIVGIWLPKNRFLEYAWQISSVGIAAQLATFPISVYYFHMFPTYFILSNLIAIPGAFLIMSVGVPFMVLAKVPYVSEGLGWVVEKLILLLNQLIFAVQGLPMAKISNLHIDPVSIWMYWFVLAMLLLLWVMPMKWQLYTGMLALLVFGAFHFSKFVFPSDDKELLLYASGNGFAMDYRQNGAVFYWEESVEEADLSYKVLPNRGSSGETLKLPAFGLENNLKVWLPKGNGTVTFTGAHLVVSPEATVKAVHHWKNEQWMPLDFKDTIPVGTNAIKINLN